MARSITGTIELTELPWGQEDDDFWRANVYVFTRGSYIRDRVKVQTFIMEGEKRTEEWAAAWCALHVHREGALA